MRTSRIKIQIKSKIHTSRVEMMVLSLQLVRGQLQIEVDNAFTIPNLYHLCSFVNIDNRLETSIVTIVLGDHSLMQISDDYTQAK